MDRYPDSCDPFAWATAFCNGHCVHGSKQEIAEWFKMAFRAGMHGYDKRDTLWKPKITGMGARVGDTVHISGVVSKVDLAPLHTCLYGVYIPTSGQYLSFNDKDIVHVEPRKLAVGDHVSLPGLSQRSDGVIRAIDGDDAWVLWSNGARAAYRLEVLLRVIPQ